MAQRTHRGENEGYPAHVIVGYEAWVRAIAIVHPGKLWHTRSGIGANAADYVDAVSGDRFLGEFDRRNGRGWIA